MIRGFFLWEDFLAPAIHADGGLKDRRQLSNYLSH